MFVGVKYSAKMSWAGLILNHIGLKIHTVPVGLFSKLKQQHALNALMKDAKRSPNDDSHKNHKKDKAGIKNKRL